MEKIAGYLEKIGYKTEEQSASIAKYLILFKEDMPIGFLLADYSLSLVDKTDEEKLKKIIEFVKGNENAQLVGGHEYLLATYAANQLTTYFDTELMQVRYTSYITDENGEMKPQVYSDPYQARLDFAIRSNMLNSADVKRGSGKFKNRIIDKAVNYLIDKKSD